jgi:hypothetical protein
MLFEPLAGERRLLVTDRWTAADLALGTPCIGRGASMPQPNGLCWSWTTSTCKNPASLYEAFAPAEARRLMDRLEIHYTPKHGS